MAEITKKDILEVLQEFSKKALDPTFERIDQRFDQIDHRFEDVDRRFDQMDQRFAKADQRFENLDQGINGLDHKVDQFKEEIIHRFHVISKDVISQVNLVGEGVVNLDGKFTREMTQFRKENEQGHQEIMAMIKFSYAELDRRISTLGD